MKIAFIGESPQVGCSMVAACAGIGLAERLGAKVLVIEASFEQPDLAQLFGLEATPGLSEVLSGEARLEDALRATEVPGLSILPGGQGTKVQPGCFASAATRKILEEATTGHQYVLLDLASIVRQPEARLLLWDASTAVVVARGGVTRKDRMRTLAEVIRGSGGCLLGAVLDQYRTVRPAWLPGPDEELKVVAATAVVPPQTG